MNTRLAFANRQLPTHTLPFRRWQVLSSGVGKTHLAIALGLAACGQGREVRFSRLTELITLLMEARDEKQLLRFRKQIKQLDLLILDELGYVPTGRVGA